MEHKFWHDRWQNQETGFHEGTPNRHLVKYLSTLPIAPRAHIFLPLCGKTVDIDWLMDQGHAVTGIELSQNAVREVFARMKLTPEISRTRGLTRFAAPGLTLWSGDFFDLRPEDLTPIHAIYDRAALVALPPPMRADYVHQLATLCGPVPQLLISYDYDQTQTGGPPFSVPETAIHRLHGGHYDIRPLASTAIDGPLANRCKGQEQAWSLTPLHHPRP